MRPCSFTNALAAGAGILQGRLPRSPSNRDEDSDSGHGSRLPLRSKRRPRPAHPSDSVTRTQSYLNHAPSPSRYRTLSLHCLGSRSHPSQPRSHCAYCNSCNHVQSARVLSPAPLWRSELDSSGSRAGHRVLRGSGPCAPARSTSMGLSSYRSEREEIPARVYRSWPDMASRLGSAGSMVTTPGTHRRAFSLALVPEG